MKNKTIFLDRDGTINEDLDYVYRLEDLKFLPKVIEGLRLLQNAGYKEIIITNQSGIGRGFYTEDDYLAFRGEMHKKLEEQGIKIDAEYFCPHHPDKNCNCRKPKTGMLERAARDFNLDPMSCWMIGDSEKDIQAGKNAGCKTAHVLTGKHKMLIDYADFIGNDLLEIAYYILTQDKIS